MKRHTYDAEDGGQLWYDLYSEEEYIQKFWPIAKKVYQHKTSWMHLNTIDTFPFNDPNWVLVMLIGDVSCWSTSNEEDTKWERAKTDVYDRDELTPLWEILSEDGVKEIILCDAEMPGRMPDRKIEAAVFPPERDFVLEPYTETGLISLLPHYLFDRSARWGIVGMMEEESLLGGDAEFMTRFIEKAGGLSELQRRFRAHVINGYSLHAYDLAYWRRIYEIVRWPFPFEGIPKAEGPEAQEFIESQK